MHLQPDRLLFGVAPSLLIDCARQIHDWAGGDGKARAFTLEEFSEALGAPIGESVPVLEEMLAAGFFDGAGGGVDRYIATPKLGQLALAKVSHGLPRDEAARLLDQVVKKAAEINASPEGYGYRVACVVVFGSWLSDKPRLGDLDIGVEVAELPGASRQSPQDESMHDWIRKGVAARNRALRALRLRQPKKISVHQLHEVVELGTPYEVVFGTLPD